MFYIILTCSPYLAALLTTIFCVAGLGRLRVCLACWLTAALHSIAWYLGYGDEEKLFFTIPAMLAFSVVSILILSIETVSSFEKRSKSKSVEKESSNAIPHNIDVVWTDEPMPVKVRQLLKSHQDVKWIYVESLDSNPNFENVCRTLTEFGLGAELFAGKFPIVQINEEILTALNDERIFPGYDTLWFVTDPSLIQCPPPVRLEIASYEIGNPPAQREGKPQNPWDLLADWMNNSDVEFGISIGSTLVVVQRENSP